MIKERKTEEFEDDQKKWKIYFDLETEGRRENLNVIVGLMINRKEYPLTEKDLENLKQDLKDLGKLRIIKQGKEFLDKCKEVT